MHQRIALIVELSCKFMHDEYWEQIRIKDSDYPTCNTLHSIIHNCYESQKDKLCVEVTALVELLKFSAGVGWLS